VSVVASLSSNEASVRQGADAGVVVDPVHDIYEALRKNCDYGWTFACCTQQGVGHSRQKKPLDEGYDHGRHGVRPS